MKFIAVIIGIALMTTASAAERKLSFQTKHDKFELSLAAGKGQVGAQPADLSSVKDMLPLLSKALPDDCPTFKRPPDITVKEGDKVRSIYVDDGVVSDGKKCITVSGDGLFYFPLHRDFLVGPKTEGLKLKSPLKVFVDGKKLFELKKQGESWVNETPEALLDWDFIARLEDSLKHFDVRLRVQTGIGKDKQKVIIQSGPDTLEFYKVTSVMWALKKPGQPWLTASDEWSYWRDFDSSLFEDRFAGEIRAIESAKDRDAKMEILNRVETSWSRNLRDLYVKLATNETEDTGIRSLSLKRLKSKPSLETSGAMIKILEDSKNDDLRDDAAVILKLNNPKGVKFKSSDAPEDQQKALEYWKKWWQDKGARK